MDNNQREIELLRGLARNDSRSVEEIYREQFPMVRQLVLTNNGSVDDAADLFQEAMIVLYDRSTTAGFELTCQLKTFVYSICKRLWLKKLNAKGRFVYLDSMEDTVPVEEDLTRHDEIQSHFSLMESAMQKVGEPCKSLLEAYYLQKKPMQEIADHFGYTNADNAKTQKYKCMVRLKKLFFGEYNKK